MGSRKGPVRTKVTINGHTKDVLRFDGQALLESRRLVPPIGSLFVVFQSAKTAAAGQRLIGWEDSDVGKHGLSLMPEPGGALRAILRNHGQAGDLRRYPASVGIRNRLRHLGPERHDAASQRGGGRFEQEHRGCIIRPGDPRPASGWAGLREQSSVSRGCRGDPRLSTPTGRRRAQAGRDRTAPVLVRTDRSEFDPEGPTRRTVRRADVRPGAVLVAGGRTEGGSCPPKTDRAWPA